MVVSTNLRVAAPQRFSATPATPAETPSLPDVATISARAAASAPPADAAPEAPVQSGSWARTAGLTAMAAVAGIGALAATAAPAQADTRVGVTIGPNGVGVHVENYQNPWGHRGGHGHGHGHHHGQHCDNHGPFFTAVAKDGRVHRIDRFNHVNDHTGHYIIRTNPWTGAQYRDYNVGERCSW